MRAFIYNKVSHKDFDCIEVDECDESRIEIIDERISITSKEN